MKLRNGVRALALCAFALACAHAPTPVEVTTWRDAVIATQQQSDVALRGVNTLAREAALERAASLTTLKESDFEPALDAQSLAIWHSAFDDLAVYGQALARLADPAAAAAVGPALTRLSQTAAAQANSELFQQRPGLATAIGRFGAAAAVAGAQTEAHKIMQQTDPEVSALLGEMGRMIADTDPASGEEIGVVATVRTHWTDRANLKRVDFLKAAQANNAAGKREAAREYARALEQRSGAEQILRELKRSLDSLAASHTAMAQGGSGDLAALIAGVRLQTQLAQALIDDLQKTQP